MGPIRSVLFTDDIFNVILLSDIYCHQEKTFISNSGVQVMMLPFMPDELDHIIFDHKDKIGHLLRGWVHPLKFRRHNFEIVVGPKNTPSALTLRPGLETPGHISKFKFQIQ